MHKVQVWDIGIRIFHWSLVFFFIFSYLTGDEFDTIHSYSGYAIAVLLIFRIVWGFIGSTYARFKSFIFSPLTTHEYTLSLMKGQPKHYYGHNPLASLMVFALIIALSATIFTGLKAYGLQGEGLLASSDAELVSETLSKAENEKYVAQYSYLEEEEEHFWEDTHELFANLVLLLVFIHIIGVIISSVVHKESVFGSMIDGKKEPPQIEESHHH